MAEIKLPATQPTTPLNAVPLAHQPGELAAASVGVWSPASRALGRKESSAEANAATAHTHGAPRGKLPSARRRITDQDELPLVESDTAIENTAQAFSAANALEQDTLPAEPSAAFSGSGLTMSESVLVAQLELPTLPPAPSGAGPAASSAGPAASSSFGGLAGLFGGAAALGLLAGGQGGGQSAGLSSGAAAPAPAPALGISGRLVNGYIDKAIVFQDNDGDGVLDNDQDGVDEAGEEPFAITGSDGKFNLVGANPAGASLMTLSTANTVDMSTGERVTSVFKAPANATVISPLSTLIEAGAKTGMDEEMLKTAFGIDPSTSLLNFDPVSSATTGNAAAATQALKVKAASVMVSNLMDVGSSLIQGAKNAASADFSAAVVTSLVTSIKNNPTGLDLSQASAVTTVLTQALSASSVSTSDALTTVVGHAANKLKDGNAQLMTQSSGADPMVALENMAKVEKAVQSTVANSVKEAVQDSSNTSKVAALQNLNVQTEATNAVVPKLVVFETLNFNAAQNVKADAFEGATAAAVVQSDNNTVMSFVKAAGSSAANAGATLSTGKVGTLGTLNTFDFSTTTKLGMWVHSAQAGTKVRLEIGDSAAGGYPKDNNWVAVESSTTKAGWEYLNFDFSAPSSRFIANGGSGGYVGTTALKSSVNYDMLNVFFDLGSTKLTSQTYHFDALGYAKASPGAAPLDIAYQTAQAVPAGYTLAFSDEFGGEIASVSNASKATPDASKWLLQTGKGPNGDGWGNGESQTYTNTLDNAYVQNGALRIVANKTGDSITSARLKSVADMEPYGYMEVRAKIPAAQGAWPAIWMLGKGTWPDTGEIDVMEWTQKYFGTSEVQAALHFKQSYGDTQFKKSTTLSSPITDFHTYQVWWTQDYIRFGVDSNNDNAYYEYKKPNGATPANWPFDNPMDIILNLAIGGTLGGTVPAGNFSYEMAVDYVRLYQGPAIGKGSDNGANRAHRRRSRCGLALQRCLHHHRRL